MKLAIIERPEGPPACVRLVSTWTPHAVAPGGLSEGHHGREVGEGGVKMKLHAVAPGGPPEGQCEDGHETVCNATFCDPFPTSQLYQRRSRPHPWTSRHELVDWYSLGRFKVHSRASVFPLLAICRRSATSARVPVTLSHRLSPSPEWTLRPLPQVIPTKYLCRDLWSKVRRCSSVYVPISRNITKKCPVHLRP